LPQLLRKATTVHRR